MVEQRDVKSQIVIVEEMVLNHQLVFALVVQLHAVVYATSMQDVDLFFD